MSISEMKKNTVQSEKDVALYLSDFSRGIRKFWWISVAFAVLCGGFVLYWTYVRFVPMYQASATFTVLTQNETLSGDESQSAYSFSYSRTTAERLSTVFLYVSQSDILQKRVCEDLGVSSMPASISVDFVTGTNMMTVSASGQDPRQVYNVLLSFIDHYGDVTTYIIGPTQLVIIAEPELPVEPYNARFWQKATVKGVLFGLALGAAWIVLYAVLRQTIRTKADIRQELNQACIGVLPQVAFKRHKRKIDTNILLTNPAVGGTFLESIRLLRDAVQNGLQGNENVIVITSTAPEEGKSVITLNLAAMLGKNDKKVLVVDADLRNSGISKLLHMDRAKPAAGETEKKAAALYHILNYAPLGIDVLTFDTQAHHLRQIIRTDQMREIVDSLRTQYDLILIDTPPCGMISDAAIIAGAADAAVCVVRQDTVLTSRIRDGINALLSTDIRLMGCVLNGAAVGIGGYGHYYGYGGYKQNDSKAYTGKHGVLRKHRTEKDR